MAARITWIGLALAVALSACGPGNDGPDADADGPDAGAPDADALDADLQTGPCPDDMVLVDDGAGRPFCIERYEYPGVAGAPPQPNMAWYQAAEACVERRRELCLGDQWERACAGTPADACAGPIGASGARPGCVSSAGVHDLPGNMAEWTADIGIDVAYVVMGGAGQSGADAGPGGEIGCEVSEEIDAEVHRVFLGFRCCARARLED